MRTNVKQGYKSIIIVGGVVAVVVFLVAADMHTDIHTYIQTCTGRHMQICKQITHTKGEKRTRQVRKKQMMMMAEKEEGKMQKETKQNVKEMIRNSYGPISFYDGVVVVDDCDR